MWHNFKKVFDKYPKGSYTVCNWYGKKLGTFAIVTDLNFNWTEYRTSYQVSLCISKDSPEWYILSTKFNSKYTNWLVPESGQQERAEAIVDKELRKLRFAWIRRYK